MQHRRVATDSCDLLLQNFRRMLEQFNPESGFAYTVAIVNQSGFLISGFSQPLILAHDTAVRGT